MRFILGPRAEIPALAARRAAFLSGIKQAAPEVPKLEGFVDHLQRLGHFDKSS